MHILCYVSGHGFGHAARVCEVLRALRARRPDVEPMIRSPLARWFFDFNLGGSFEYAHCQLDVGVVQADSLSVDLRGDAARLRGDRCRRGASGRGGGRGGRGAAAGAGIRRHSGAGLRRRRAARRAGRGDDQLLVGLDLRRLRRASCPASRRWSPACGASYGARRAVAAPAAARRPRAPSRASATFRSWRGARPCERDDVRARLRPAARRPPRAAVVRRPRPRARARAGLRGRHLRRHRRRAPPAVRDARLPCR